MRRVLYIDELTDVGRSRLGELQEKLADDVLLEGVDESVLALDIPDPNRWDLIVADLRGMDESRQFLIEELVETSPDTVLILIVDSLNERAAAAVRWYGAVDCISWHDGYETSARVIRQFLLRLKIARDSISSMNSRVEAFDVTLELGLDRLVAEPLANYTLCHLAQMDVCGLRSQLRSIRAFEEAVELLLETESSKCAGTDSDDRDASVTTAPSADADPIIGSHHIPPFARVRLHLSRDGFRFTLRGSSGIADYPNMWFAPLLMDEVEYHESRQELVMLQLPDDVCSVVSDAMARHLAADVDQHDLLSDVLRVVRERQGHVSH